MAIRRVKAYEVRTIRNEGALIHLFKEGEGNYKFHNWDGPAIDPYDSNSKHSTEYYLYGMKLSKDEWNERRQQREGLPYYKNPSMKHLLSDGGRS